MYRDIIKNTSDDFETERLTNLSASAVHCLEKPDMIDSIEDDTYELCYNKACQLMTEGTKHQRRRGSRAFWFPSPLSLLSWGSA